MAVSASVAAPTVAITMTPGLTERARQDSSAAPISPAAAITAELPRRAVINEASSSPWDRWVAFPIPDAVGASNAVTHPWACTPIASVVKAIRSPAATNAAARLRSPTCAPATSKSAIPMSTMVVMLFWMTSILQDAPLSPPRTPDPRSLGSPLMHYATRRPRWRSRRREPEGGAADAGPCERGDDARRIGRSVRIRPGLGGGECGQIVGTTSELAHTFRDENTMTSRNPGERVEHTVSKVVTRESPPQVHGPCSPSGTSGGARTAVDQLALVVGQADAGTLRGDRPGAVGPVRQGSGCAAGRGEPGAARRAGGRRRVPGLARSPGGRSERLSEPPAVVPAATRQRRCHAQRHRLFLHGVRGRRGVAELLGWPGNPGRRSFEVRVGSGITADRGRPVLPLRLLPAVADRRWLAARNLPGARPAGAAAAAAHRRCRRSGAG